MVGRGGGKSGERHDDVERRLAREEREKQDRALDEAAFAVLVRVLRDGLVPPLDALSSKTLRVVLSGDHDLEITQEAFLAHWQWRKPKPGTFRRRAAPALIAALMQGAGVTAVGGELVTELPAGTVRAVRGFPAWDHPAHDLCFAFDGARLIVRLRERAQGQETAASACQPLAPLPPFSPRPRVERAFDPPRGCPRCGWWSSVFRQVQDSVQCGGCGRTFLPEELTPVTTQ